MVGIVIVSHSRKLAEGVRELAAQMVQGKVPLAVAAGIDDSENPLGTDAIQVYEAIASIYNDEGVIVLMDLGSALMSAEMALEFLSEEQRGKVHLCEAPLVEGAIAAAVTAASGSNIQQVIAQARGALIAKATQLGVAHHFTPPPVPLSTEEVGSVEQPQIKETRVVIRNPLGLHARPAAKFVTTAARFHSQIKVQNITKSTEAVRADSINQVATLGVRQGHELVITATGSDADEALAALQALVESNFGEEDSTPSSHHPIFPSPHLPITPSPHYLQGIPASNGVAIAPAFLYHPTPINVQQYHVDDIEQEWQHLQVAIQMAYEEIQALLSQATIQIGDAEAAIFDAHLLFLEDPVVIEGVHQRIFEQHLNAEAAWQEVVNELADNYRTIEDSYLQERVADVIDVGQRVLRLLSRFESHLLTSEHNPTHLNLSEPAILVTTDISASDTARLDPTRVLGICTTSGSALSHSAIIARRLGIPAIFGLPPEILKVANNTFVALDGEIGRVWIEPEPDIQTALEAKQNAQQIAHQQAITTAAAPAVTRDQTRQIRVYANIGGIFDTEEALSLGAEGVGLFRTEFLYLERTTPPSEEEQIAVYQRIAQHLDNRPLIIRTLDVGGDKPIPYLNFPQESNPFLGWRGIRFCLDHPDIFKTQLRAILKASLGHKIKIMFPMIATVQEIQVAKAMLAEVQAELRQASISFDEKMEVGMMVEIPSAVVLAEQLAAEVDFFSIGTNDLSQYVMAADRTHPQVASLVDAMHPAVLRMIQQTVQAAHKAGICVGLCGELAANPLAAPILLGLGLDEVSLNPQAIPAFKQAIAQLTMAEAEAIATLTLQQDSAAKAREIVLAFLSHQVNDH
ncbi:MAG: phosphoenolpyruvate--protein phosphotransferase [Scytonema sp. RU_4_4]|nr:phosphoenolpyruvate--protein phosphotransferase [Scytonema sp. RU_4_4]NJR74523.1 phosphoenolpyruvate--protein phosphotransferase [Scytonema sp. CRU_2_7]